MAVAESLILQKGFVGTSIDEILEKAAITKGGFFYHFNGKAQLARALVERYLTNDDSAFKALFERADTLSEDPLQRLLIFLKLLAEMVGGMSEVHPGCLVGAFTYELQQLDDETRTLMEKGMLGWRNMIARRLDAVMEKYEPRIEVSVESLADMFSAIIEGGIILARIFDNNQALIAQVEGYRQHIRLVFADA